MKALNENNENIVTCSGFFKRICRKSSAESSGFQGLVPTRLSLRSRTGSRCCLEHTNVTNAYCVIC